MTIYDIAYQEHYSGSFQVEADSPEQAVEIFTDMLNENITFNDYVSSRVEGDGSEVTCDGVSIYAEHPEHAEIINNPAQANNWLEN